MNKELEVRVRKRRASVNGSSASAIYGKGLAGLPEAQSLGDDKKGEAEEIWQQIESLEGQLRQTLRAGQGRIQRRAVAKKSKELHGPPRQYRICGCDLRAAE